MRYADGPTTEVEVHVAAPPGAVWPLVSDINVPARFSSEFRRAEWQEGCSPGLGARFVGHNHHDAIGDWQTTSTVVEFEPDQRFGWAVGDPGHPSAQWRFELAAEDGGTRLRQWMRLGPAPGGLTPAIERWPDKEERIIDRRLAEHRANMAATLRGIKELAETGGS